MQPQNVARFLQYYFLDVFAGEPFSTLCFRMNPRRSLSSMPFGTIYIVVRWICVNTRVRFPRRTLEAPLVTARTNDISVHEAMHPIAVDRTVSRRAPQTEWHPVHESEHVVQFYETDTFLLEALTDFMGTGLVAGDACIVVATPVHRMELEERLQVVGLDVVTARASGQYVALDAAETLEKFMVDGSPNPGRFATEIGQIIAPQARAVRMYVYLGKWSRCYGRRDSTVPRFSWKGCGTICTLGIASYSSAPIQCTALAGTPLLNPSLTSVPRTLASSLPRATPRSQIRMIACARSFGCNKSLYRFRPKSLSGRPRWNACGHPNSATDASLKHPPMAS